MSTIIATTRQIDTTNAKKENEIGLHARDISRAARVIWWLQENLVSVLSPVEEVEVLARNVAEANQIPPQEKLLGVREITFQAYVESALDSLLNA